MAVASTSAERADTSVAQIAQPNRMELMRQVWKLALPVILTNLLQSLVDVIDVFMVGRLGPIAIAAVGMSSALRMLVLVMMLSVAAGAMSLIANKPICVKSAPRLWPPPTPGNS